MDQLVKRMLAVGGRFAPVDRSSVVIYWRADDTLARTRLDYALIGTGALTTPGHRFSNPASWPPHVAGALGPIHDPLIKVIKLAEQFIEKVGEEHYHPVADLCNRLFFVPPFKDAAMFSKDISALEAAIADVNDRLVTVSMSALCATSTTVIIAGGQDKGYSIRGALSHLDRHVELFTDVAAARVALNEPE